MFPVEPFHNVTNKGLGNVIQSCSQESTSVISIMQDVLCSVRADYPNVTKASFRQDNSGCYHSSATILACLVVSNSTGVQIRRIDFSDSQGGRSSCSHTRVRLTFAVTSLTKATQLKDALVSHGGIGSVRLACLDKIPTASPIFPLAQKYFFFYFVPILEPY